MAKLTYKEISEYSKTHDVTFDTAIERLLKAQGSSLGKEYKVIRKKKDDKVEDKKDK